MPQKVIYLNNMNMEPCPNCKGGAGDKLMQCPHCEFKFCGQCFHEIPDGDGRTFKCPNNVCNIELELGDIKG